MKQLEELFVQYKHSAPKNIEELPSSGSNRRYFRLTADDDSTIIGVMGTSEDENIADDMVTGAVLDNPHNLTDVAHHVWITVFVNNGKIKVLAVFQPHLIAEGFDTANAVEAGEVQNVFKVKGPAHSPITPRARRSTKLPSRGKLYIYTTSPEYTMRGLRSIMASA